MVGFDKPIESHDMILRWMGVDFLVDAAGPSARIPSQLGDEPERVLVIGSGISSSGKAGKGMIVGADGKTEAQVAEEAKWTAYYNAGTAALIFLIVSVLIGSCVLLRLRRRSRLQRRRHPSLGSGSLGPITLSDRNGTGATGPASTETHELSHLVSNQEGVDDDDVDYQESGPESARSALALGHKVRGRQEINLKAAPRSRRGQWNTQDLGTGESLFDVGDDDDDESNKEGEGPYGAGSQASP